MSPKLIMLAATLAVGAAVPAAAQYGHNEFSANLRGNAEVPGPGKMNASGMATVQVNPGRNRICYRINSQNIPRATMAHIHSGRAGVEGPPVVTLRVNSSGEGNSCVGVSRRLARDIIDRPGAFYVNVHSQAFPTGAIRGQLRR